MVVVVTRSCAGRPASPRREAPAWALFLVAVAVWLVVLGSLRPALAAALWVLGLLP